jgi:hypothetical protein
VKRFATGTKRFEALNGREQGQYLEDCMRRYGIGRAAPRKQSNVKRQREPRAPRAER